jgi:hypothetical protein
VAQLTLEQFEDGAAYIDRIIASRRHPGGSVLDP